MPILFLSPCIVAQKDFDDVQVAVRARNVQWSLSIIVGDVDIGPSRY